MEKKCSQVVSTEFRINENREYRLSVVLFSFFCGGDLYRRKQGIRIEKKTENGVKKTVTRY